MYCSQCNSSVSETARFCSECGVKLVVDKDLWLQINPAPKSQDEAGDLRVADDKLVEKKLQASERRFSLFMQYLPGAAWMKDHSGRYAFVNKTAEQVFGRSAADCLGRTDDELFPSETAAEFRENDRAALQTPGGLSTIEKLRHTDGLHYSLVHKFPIAEATGMPPLVGGIAIDITEQLKAEKTAQRFQAAIDNSTDAIHLIDPHSGRLLDFNTSAHQRLGYSREEFLALSVTDIEADLPGHFQWQEHVDQLRAAGHVTFPGRHRRKNGVTFPVEVNVRYVVDPIQDYMIAVARDVSDRKQSENALRISEERFRLVWDIAADGMRLTDATGEIIAVNPAYCRIIGKPREELEGQQMAAVYIASDREYITAGYRDCFARRDVQAFSEKQMTLWDGRKVWLEFSFCFLDALSQPPLLLSIFRDVGDRRLAEQSLKSHSEILLNMSEAVSFIDEQGFIRFTNPAHDKMFGYESGDLVGRHVTVLNDPTFEAKQLVVGEVMAAMQSTCVCTGEFRNRRKDGTTFWTSTRISRIEQPDVHFFISVQQDITARKNADLELAALRDQLAHSARLGTLGEMASGLAHELNQPLAALHLFAKTGLRIGSQLNSPELNTCLQEISAQSLRAGEIIRRMRAFASRSAPMRLPVHLNSLIHEVLTLLAPELQRSGVEFTLRLQNDLPSIVVDGIQIQQVIVNLIRNSLDAMSDNSHGTQSIIVGTSVAGDKVRVAITDSGRGIDASILAKLFLPFQTTKPMGLGLGLAISRTLIEAHGGQIAVEPNSEKGATFYFLLPVAGTTSE